jgi:predicted Zn-dependent peptidase
VNGISHFVEHMVFKGTTSRTAQELAREVDQIGGNLDAFTGKEQICFNIKCLDENLVPALDLLSDLVLHPTFAAEDVAKEQGVILEEIKMDEDNPDAVVHEIYTQNFWKDDALGRPILGTVKTVSGFDREVVRREYGRRFTPANLVFSAAGRIEHDTFVAQVEAEFGELGVGSGEGLVKGGAPAAHAHVTLKSKKSLEQVQVCLGVPAPGVTDARRYGIYLLNTMLGGGMSSRLFQTIREDEGMAYSIYSEMSPFRDVGSLSVYAGTSVDKVEKLVRLTLKEFGRLKEEMVPAGELKRAKDQLKSNIVLGLESSSSRMANLARQQMYYGRFFGVDEITQEIERVTSEEILEIARELLVSEKVALTLLGNLGKLKMGRGDLVC